MDIKTGKFLVAPGRAVAGELTIAGPDSSIVLRDDAVFPIGAEPNLCITGTLYDQTMITLIAASMAVVRRGVRPRLTHRSTDFGSTSAFAARAAYVHPPAVMTARRCVRVTMRSR